MIRTIGFLLLLGTAGYAQRIKDIATVAGLRYVHLKGIGIVAGLNGTGDSPKNVELQRKFLKILSYWGSGDAQIATRNIALVLVTATVPSSTKVGQTFPVHVASIGDAKDLVGGELLECALRGPISTGGEGSGTEIEFTDYAVAQGKVTADANDRVKTNGASSAILEQEFGIPFHTDYEYITLLLNQPDFTTASGVAEAINTCGYFGESARQLAKAVDAGTIRVRIPPAYTERRQVVDFASIILGQIPLAPGAVDRRAKVVLDRRSGTIVVNGEARVRRFSAVIDGLVIRIPPAGTASEEPGGAPILLMDVISEFRNQKLTTEDIMSVIDAMHEANVLEAELVEER